MTGLGKDWAKIIKTLSRISDYYRDLHSAVSIGKSKDVRKRTAELFLEDPKIVLDLGAGDGLFTETILSLKSSVGLVVMLDALVEMLKRSNKMDKVEKIQALFEYLPFRDQSFDHVIAAFSLRDAISLERALSEVKSTLKEHGKLIVVDLGKPSSKLKRFLIYLYWIVVAPIIAILKLGSRGFAAIEIIKTLKHCPNNSNLAKLYKKYFPHIIMYEKFIGGLIMLQASRDSLRECS